jgi:hypothetical protein
MPEAHTSIENCMNFLVFIIHITCILGVGFSQKADTKLPPVGEKRKNPYPRTIFPLSFKRGPG